METAPKGGRADRYDDPKWVEPPQILLKFEHSCISVAVWEYYYAEGGRGCTDGVAWIEPCSGEPLNLHYDNPVAWASLD